MEDCPASRALVPPEHWWSPLEFAPRSASEHGSTSEQDEEFTTSHELAIHGLVSDQGANTGSALCSAPAEAELNECEEGESKQSMDSPYDRIETFTLSLKQHLEKTMPQTDSQNRNETEAPQGLASDLREDIQGAREESIYNAELQLKQLLTTFKGMKERMVTLLQEDTEVSQTKADSSSHSSNKEPMSDSEEEWDEEQEYVKALSAPVVDLSRPLPRRTELCQGLGDSSLWSETSDAHAGRSNTISTFATESTSHSFTVGNGDAEEDDLISPDDWREDVSDTEQNLADSDLLDIIRTHATTSSEASDFSTASLSQQIDGAKLTDFDDDESLFDDDFDHDPEPYEPDTVPIIRNLTRLSLPGTESRFSQFVDAPHHVSHVDPPASSDAWINSAHLQAEYGGHKLAANDPTRTQYPAVQPLERSRLYSGIASSDGLSSAARAAVLSQKGLLSPRVAASSSSPPVSRTPPNSDHHISLGYARYSGNLSSSGAAAALLSPQTRAAPSAHANPATIAYSQQPNTTTRQHHTLALLPAGVAQAGGAAVAVQLGADLYASAPVHSHVLHASAPASRAPSSTSLASFQPQESPLPPVSFPPSAYTEMQRERLAAATRQQMREGVVGGPASSLYSSTPGNLRDRLEAWPGGSTTALRVGVKTVVEDVM